MANNIPLYGANKDGGDLGAWADFLQGACKIADHKSIQIAGNASDVTVFTAGTEKTQVLGYSLYVTNLTGTATDFQANVKINTVSGTLTSAGVEENIFEGGGELDNADTVLLELTGSANQKADVRVIVWGSVNLDNA